MIGYCDLVLLSLWQLILVRKENSLSLKTFERKKNHMKGLAIFVEGQMVSTDHQSCINSEMSTEAVVVAEIL